MEVERAREEEPIPTVIFLTAGAIATVNREADK